MSTLGSTLFRFVPPTDAACKFSVEISFWPNVCNKTVGDGIRTGASGRRVRGRPEVGAERRENSHLAFECPGNCPCNLSVSPSPSPSRHGRYYKFARCGAGALMRGWCAPSWCKQIFLLWEHELRLFPVGYISGRVGERVKADKKGRVREVWA
jgi:hypothetical protein